jgi:putative PIN family toxin of toxin-antitoxin system
VRAVLDVNVLVSALISRTSAPTRLVELWLLGDLELVVCEALLAELERALAYPKVRQRIAAADADRFVLVLRELAEVVPDPEEARPVGSPDPGDDYLLVLAARERAQLVSGDEHLLSLRERVPVSSPREFLELLEGR